MDKRLNLIPILLLVVIALAASFLARPDPATLEAPADRSSAWETLGLEGSERDFDTQLGALNRVVLDPAPEVGTEYHPTFPDDVPFNEEEWETNPLPPSVADPRARKGGTLRLGMSEFPPTLRTEGPNSRLKTLSDIHGLIYETLLGYDMNLGDYVPGLATHWQIGDDRLTYRFRLDPRARWADGRPLTADDVVATFDHLRNEDRQDPALAQHYNEQIESVTMIDRHTVEIKARNPEWRTMLELAGTRIYPAAYIRMDGETYLTEWNWKLPPGTGPYELLPENVDKGRAVTLHRREDYWDKDHPQKRHMFNFDAIRWEVVLDDELLYQKFLAGELDAMLILRAQRWVDDVDRERAVQQGWVQKRKIYNLEPQGYGGFAFNMRTAPFDSRNVREAFAHLFNREQLFEKFFFFQYEYIDSYFPGQIWARPGARRVQFNPARARELLAADGWTGRDAQGYLVNEDRRRFPVLHLDFAQDSFQRIFEVVQRDLWQEAGIKLELSLVDGASLLKKVWDQKFQLVYWSWTASLFPDMEFQFGSKYADEPQSNNLNGFKNAEADAIMQAYKSEFDFDKRVQLMHRLDAILFDEHPYALGWFAPYFRILYWDRFGHPPEYGERFVGDTNVMTHYWWVDPEKEQQLEHNQATNTASYPGHRLNQYDEVDQRYWLTHEEPMP